jgi:hypothetical protein
LLDKLHATGAPDTALRLGGSFISTTYKLVGHNVEDELTVSFGRDDNFRPYADLWDNKRKGCQLEGFLESRRMAD